MRSLTTRAWQSAVPAGIGPGQTGRLGTQGGGPGFANAAGAGVSSANARPVASSLSGPRSCREIFLHKGRKFTRPSAG